MGRIGPFVYVFSQSTTPCAAFLIWYIIIFTKSVGEEEEEDDDDEDEEEEDEEDEEGEEVGLDYLQKDNLEVRNEIKQFSKLDVFQEVTSRV